MKDIVFKTIMLKGEAGGTISSIDKTSSIGNIDVYTITLNDGTTQNFEVTNGLGIASIEKTGTSGLVDTYTITYENGDTTTFEITNGANGVGYEVPAGSVIYYDNDDTPQGYEPTTNPDIGVFQAPLGKGSYGTEASPRDLDNLVGENSVYFVNTSYATNAPISSGYGFLENVSANSAASVQRFTVYSAPGYGDTYIRIYINSQWYSWTKIAQAIT